MKSSVLTLLLTLCISFNLIGQKDDPVLFSVAGKPVHLSEFKYIYNKTNGPNADFSKASLQEYLDLYVHFKLKVAKAKEMKLDTISSLIEELAGYRRQLADSYLIDREVTEKLVAEAYERTRFDVDLSHIMIEVPDIPTPSDTLNSWNRALEAKKRLDKGDAFDVVAREFSDDNSVNENNGHIGLVTALFPNGFYALETAAYNAEPGRYYGPIRTASGYHIILVHGRRPARGEIEVSHILIRLEKAEEMVRSRLKIDSVYNALKGGANFEELAGIYSEDNYTSYKGGYIGFFGINRYEKSFEDEAFDLKNDGDISPVVQTSIGWHIIKRISLKNNETFAQMKTRLQNLIKEDARFELSTKAMVERIKKDSHFKENRTTLEHLITTLEKDTSQTFLTYKWKAPEKPLKSLLFLFGKNLQITQGDFENYLQRSSRQRQQMSEGSIREAVEVLYNEFIVENALKYEERQLDAKYPDFNSLMREYVEGVLLFEVTKMEVWDRASIDTVGLKNFYDKTKEKYQWGERALISQYSLVEKSKDLFPIVQKYVGNHNAKETLAQFNRPGEEVILSVFEKTYERGRSELLDTMVWKEGELSALEMSKRDGSANFFKIEKIIPPGQKSLQDARGYVVADYQDFLEKQWLQQLKNEYKVVVDSKVFNSLVKK